MGNVSRQPATTRRQQHAERRAPCPRGSCVVTGNDRLWSVRTGNVGPVPVGQSHLRLRDLPGRSHEYAWMPVGEGRDGRSGGHATRAGDSDSGRDRGGAGSGGRSGGSASTEHAGFSVAWGGGP